ncbi:MAG: efflux RND transporter periplasmic adaptor subunit [Geminicoccaceae bacterium]
MVFRRLVFGLTIVVAGIGLPGGRAGMPESGQARATYITAPVERGDLSTTLSATGTLNALVTVDVGSQLSGQIAELLVDFNDEVEKGQPLARLDPRTFRSEVREAEAALDVARAVVVSERAALEKAGADLANARLGCAVTAARTESAQVKADDARRDLERTRVLVARATLARSELDGALAAYQSAAALLRGAEAEQQVSEGAVLAAEASRKMAQAALQHAEAAVEQQSAALEQAKIDLARTVISAPIDGVVTGRNVDRGQTVAASLEAPTLFTIAQDLRQMEVHANIDEADIGRIRLGQRASFTVDAYPDRVFEGTVTQIRKAPEVIQNEVTYTVALSTQNADLALLPGMTAIVRIVVETASDVLKIPNAALRFRPPEDTAAHAAAAGEATGASPAPRVWILGVDDVPVPVRVALGRSNDSATELVDGDLRAGQEVIVGTASTPQDQSWFGLRWRL